MQSKFARCSGKTLVSVLDELVVTLPKVNKAYNCSEVNGANNSGVRKAADLLTRIMVSLTQAGSDASPDRGLSDR